MKTPWLHFSDLEQRLQGRDNFDNPHFKALAEKASLSFSDLVKLRETKQQRRVELGDLGEIIACLSLMAYFGYDPTMIYPKNLGKLNARVSDPGIDIVIITLPADPKEDAMSFVECKATGLEGRNFLSLFAAAKKTTAGITRDRVFDEVQLLAEEAKGRTSLDDASDRVQLLVFKFLAGLVSQSAHLHAMDNPAAEVGTSAASKITNVVMFQANMESLRVKAFAYRRTA